MIELVDNVFLTSLLVFILTLGYINFRANNYITGDTEKVISVVILLVSLVILIISSLTLIWI